MRPLIPTHPSRARRMAPGSWCALLLGLDLLLGGTPAGAGPPLLSQSWVDPQIVACPAGESSFVVVAMRFGPVRNCHIILDFTPCGGAQFPPPDGSEGYYWQDRLANIFTGSDGRAEFRLRVGGTCPTGSVQVYADAMPFGVRALASPDQDGNLGVGPEDVAIATSKLGTSDPTADFDGDGTVTSADLDILRAHLGHHAPGMATPVASRTWGTLKLLYR